MQGRSKVVCLKTQTGSMAALRFGTESSDSPTIIMNYGFPGDVRNYDIADSLAIAGYVTYIPHPMGVEESEGDFSFLNYAHSFDSFLRYCSSSMNVVGVVSYCYSTLWVLKTLLEFKRPLNLLMLAPVFDWQRVSRTIELAFPNGFSGFLEQCQHGTRKGFYGVRAQPERLYEEHRLVEGRMNLPKVLNHNADGTCKIVYGANDMLMDEREIDSGVALLSEHGIAASVHRIPSTDHFFVLRRTKLLQEFHSWLSGTVAPRQISSRANTDATICPT